MVKMWWRPVVFKCRVHTVSVLQLSVGKSCLVFQILHAKKIPLELIKFLENAKYMFVGVRLYNDVEKLSSDYDLKAMNVYYLQTCVTDEAKQLGYVRSEGLVKRVVWKDMEKSKRIRMSRWDNRGFTRGQVSYASLDAYFSFKIGRLLSF
ncbi:hypothetical protein MIMGU_mgv1a024474mg, partial [Erythranthe guttata]